MSGFRTNVLISEPQLMEMGIPYLPVMWGILKTYWEEHGPGGDDVAWLPPLCRMGEVSTLLAPYRDTEIDVVGLSCYTWNWSLQTVLADRIKARHPHCLVIAGGPEPDYKDPDFFRKYPSVDAVVVRDGEIAFQRILERVRVHGTPALLADPNILMEVPGLYLPGRPGRGLGDPARARRRGLPLRDAAAPHVAHLFTGPPEVPVVFSRSPYVAQSAFYERYRSALGANVIVVWETNRGCPFRCSYCDWGSSTMSKLRIFDLERVTEEIEWFARTRIGFVMLADANFGILPRDLEIADLIVAAKQRFSYPSYFSYNVSKNNPDRSVAIAKKFIAAGLASAHLLSIQHTDPEVLRATERANISTAKQIKVVEQLMHDGVPIYVQLILGIPGDTYEKWKACFASLMEWGIHSYYWVFPYNLLPNAPAAEPEYVSQWQIETIPRYVLLNHGLRPRGAFDPVLEATSRIVVSTKTFSRHDWVRMYAFAACIRGLHNGSATQSIAVYLRCTHGISYQQFYDTVIDDLFSGDGAPASWHRAILDHYRWYLEDDQAVDFMDVPELPRAAFQVDPSRWLLIRICLELEMFFAWLKAGLGRAYPGIRNLESVIEYQKNLLIVPSYDRRTGKVFPCDHDWIAYFAEARRQVVPVALPEPVATPGARVVVRDQVWSDEGVTLPLDWGAGSEDQRLERWINANVAGRNSIHKNNFKLLELETASADPAGPAERQRAPAAPGALPA